MLKLVLLFCLSISLFGSIGKVTGSIGDVYIIRDMKSMKIKTGEEVQAKDLFVSRSKSKVQITFIDETIISIGQKSSLLIEEYVFDEKNAKNSRCSFKFAKGSFRSVTGKIGKIAKENFKLKTQNANISIKGTIVMGSQSTNENGETVTTTVTTEGATFVQSNSGGAGQTVRAGQIVSWAGIIPPPIPQTASTLAINSYKTATDPSTSETPNLSVFAQPSTQTQNNSSSNNQKSNTQNKKQTQQEQSQQGTTQDDETNQMPLVPPEDEGGPFVLQPKKPDNPNPPVVPDNKEPKIPTETNSNPTITVSDATLDEDTSKLISFTGSDSDGGTLTYTISNPSHGSATLNGTQITYTPTSDYFGTDSLTLTVEDGQGGITKQTINFTINNIAEESLFTDVRISNNELQYFSENTWTNMKLSNGANAATTFSGNLPSSGFGIIGAWNSDYNIFADSLGEFASILHKTTNTDIEKVLKYTGIAPSISKLNGNEVFKYNLAYMTAFYGPEYGIAQQNTGNGDRISYYFNNETKSITRYDDSGVFGTSSLDLFMASPEFFAGKVDTTDGSVSIKRVGSNAMPSISLSNVVGNFYGSNIQGLGISGDEETHKFKQIATQSSSSAITQSGSKIFSGFSISEAYVQGVSPGINLDTVGLTVDRDTGTISGTITESGTGNDDSITFSGNVANLSSYYINDDQFGVLSSSATLGGNNKANGDSGFLVSLPDDIDSSNPLNYIASFDTDNESSWGYWEQLDDSSSMQRGFWVAGNITPINITSIAPVQNIQYTGHVLGYVKQGPITGEIPIDNTNQVIVNLNLGGGTFNANIQFTDPITQGSWNVDYTNSSVTTSGFSGTATVSASIASGSIQGQYYGTSEVKSVGGNWSATDVMGSTATGVFKADK